MLENNTGKEIAFAPPSAKGTMFGILLLVVAVAGYVFFARPLADELSVLETSLVVQNTALEKVKADMTKLDEAEKSLELSTDIERNVSLDQIPDKMQQDAVIRDLITIAENYEIDLKSISFSKGSGPNDNIGSLRISAIFEGNYLDLTDFLEGLEQNDRLFKVESINVQISQLALSDIERANFSLNIQTFFQQ